MKSKGLTGYVMVLSEPELATKIKFSILIIYEIHLLCKNSCCIIFHSTLNIIILKSSAEVFIYIHKMNNIDLHNHNESN